LSLSRTHLSLSLSRSLSLSHALLVSLSRTHLSLSCSLSLSLSRTHLSHAVSKKWSFDGLSHAVSVLKHLGSLLSSAGEFSETTSLGNPSLPLSDYLFKLQWHLTLEVIGVHESGAEGWSAQQGENELDNMEVENDDAASEARQTNPPARHTNPEPDAPSSSNGPRVSNAPRASTVPKPSRKRRAEQAAYVMRSSLQSRDDILSHKNHLIESHPDLSCSQLKAMSVLHSLSSIRMWSPLYKAAYKHLREAATNRQTFLSYEDDENKIIYLEEETGESRYA
ncbi:unnamed protein product, partial [Brassica oleracea var. botrytis]